MCRYITFKVGHKGGSARVQCIDDHLAIHGSCNLDSAICKTGSWGCTTPGDIITDSLGLWQEIGQNAAINLLLAENTLLQKSLASRVESTMQDSNELKSLGGENLSSLLGRDLAEDNDAWNLGIERHVGLDRLQGDECAKSTDGGPRNERGGTDERRRQRGDGGRVPFYSQRWLVSFPVALQTERPSEDGGDFFSLHHSCACAKLCTWMKSVFTTRKISEQVFPSFQHCSFQSERGVTSTW